MLIIPLEKSIDWRKPPLVTFLLIIINTVILIYTEQHDKNILQNSVDYYFSSVLPKIELPRYLKSQPAVSENVSNDELMASIEKGEIKTEELAILLAMMESDEAFMAKLQNDQIIRPQDTEFGEWQKARTQFENLQHNSIIERYGFIPAEQKPLTFLTHQFLHGGYDHLIGNMLFLFLIGFTLETALGGRRYLLFYLLSGLGAVGLFWLLYPTSKIPLVGASGAIAGLMGMYAGMFGLRKIRFFYSLLFYFDYIKAPALIMLPLWIANEFYQLKFTEGSNVAYMAHVGGLITGGLIALTLKVGSAKKIDTSYLDESIRQEEKAKLYQQGITLFRELKIPQARHIFADLHTKYPGDNNILMQYYSTLKLTSEAKEYRAVTEKILDKPQKFNTLQIIEVYKDYRKNNNLLQLPAHLLVKLALYFSKNRNPLEAEYILLALLQQSPEIDDLGHALFALATTWQQQGNTEKHAMCLKLLAEHYPA